MDSLTQIVLGAAVGEAVLGKKVGNKAILYGAIAGTIPDLDTLAGLFVDTVTAIEIHRGFTHSIIFSVLFAPVFGWLISKIEKRSPATWKDWSRLVFWGLFTHPILDSFTTWGTQLFWPLKTELAFKTIFVIDLLYTLPFLVFLILAIRSPKGSRKRKRLNYLGLIISSCYLLTTVGLKAITYFKFKEALDLQGYEYLEIETKPAPLNTILWTANVKLENEYLIGDYSFFDSQPIHFTSFPKNDDLAAKFLYSEKVRRLMDISNGWYIISEKDGKYFFNDLRFGVLDINDPNPGFVFSYQLIPRDFKVDVIEVERKPQEAKKLLFELGARILGN